MRGSMVWRKRPSPLLLLILLLGFGLRLYGLDHQSLWWDELKTWERATMPLPDMLVGVLNIRDQVPFYYLIMRFWGRLGTDAFTLRIFSVFWGLLSVPLIYQVGNKLGGSLTGLLSAFLLAISPFHIWYAQEARMYTLLPALLLTAHLLLLQQLRQNKRHRWLLYAFIMGAAVYTHYFAFLVALVHYVFFVLHMRQLKQPTTYWFLSMLGVGAAFVPWVWLVITRTDGYRTAVPNWISPISWRDPFLTLQVFSTGFGLSHSWVSGLGGTLFLASLIVSSQFLRKKGKGNSERPLSFKRLHTRLLFLWLCLPVLIVLLVSLDYPFLDKGSFSIYHDRYLIIILPPILLLVALGWQSARLNTALRWGLLLCLTLLSGMALVQQIADSAFARNDWRSAIARIDTTETETQVIIGYRDLLLPITYYGNERIHFVQIPPPESEEITPTFTAVMEQQLNNARTHNIMVWHAEPFYIFDPHGYPDERNALVTSKTNTVLQRWLKTRFTPLETVYLSGIRLTLYDTSVKNP